MQPHKPTPPGKICSDEIYTVSELNLQVRELIESHFELVWIEGEISNFVSPRSGHMYFSLKDAAAQVSCAMFRGRNSRLGFVPEDGMQVKLLAKVSLYEPRGNYQLIVEHMEELGDGALQKAFEQLKQKLSAEGLFDPTHKQPIPTLPRVIGIVTSPTGAAVRDIVSTLRRRFPAVPVVIFPAQVQGSGAAQTLVEAIELANSSRACDLLIVARGGGSLEDLWPFNEESVARAIFNSEISIISGVGHEVDVTISDLVADVRAATPTAAAEIAAPSKGEYFTTIGRYYERIAQSVERLFAYRRVDLHSLVKRIRHPRQQLEQQLQRLDHLDERLQSAVDAFFHRYSVRLQKAGMKLIQATPLHHIRLEQYRQSELMRRLNSGVTSRLSRDRDAYILLAQTLDTLSPLKTLSRGYCVLRKENKVVSSTQQVKVGDQLKGYLAEGVIACRVEDIERTK